MELNNDQIKSFRDQGYVFIEDLFSEDEIKLLNKEAEEVYSVERPEVMKEKNGKTIRTVFGVHTFNDIFYKLARHPRIVKPGMQLLGGEVYIHQFKLNAKMAFDGDVWQWHQDFATWKHDDDMPEPLALNVGLFLDDVTPYNGALNFIPKSHRSGYIDSYHDTKTTSYPLWTINEKTLTDLVDRGGIVSPSGKAGSVIFFDSSLVHGSPSNMSPWNRTIVYISLNRTSNHIRKFSRPEYKAQRDFEAINCLEDNCLLESM